jgi:hypothetical protein
MPKQTPARNPHAVALGRLGGKAGKGNRSAARLAAARANGKLGGRPRKHPPTTDRPPGGKVSRAQPRQGSIARRAAKEQK